MTKSWTELLGKPNQTDCVVENEIIRNTNYFTLGDFGVRRPIFEVVWRFDSNKKAQEIFDLWKKETNEHQP
jgi:hypothetical protein